MSTNRHPRRQREDERSLISDSSRSAGLSPNICFPTNFPTQQSNHHFLLEDDPLPTKCLQVASPTNDDFLPPSTKNRLASAAQIRMAKNKARASRYLRNDLEEDSVPITPSSKHHVAPTAVNTTKQEERPTRYRLEKSIPTPSSVDAIYAPSELVNLHGWNEDPFPDTESLRPSNATGHKPSTSRKGGRACTTPIKHQNDFFQLDAEVPSSETDQTGLESNDSRTAHGEDEESSFLFSSNNRRAGGPCTSCRSRGKRRQYIVALVLLLVAAGGLVYFFVGDKILGKKASAPLPLNDEDRNQDTTTNITSTPSPSANVVDSSDSETTTPSPSQTTVSPSVASDPMTTSSPSAVPTSNPSAAPTSSPSAATLFSPSAVTTSSPWAATTLIPSTASVEANTTSTSLPTNTTTTTTPTLLPTLAPTTLQIDTTNAPSAAVNTLQPSTIAPTAGPTTFTPTFDPTFSPAPTAVPIGECDVLDVKFFEDSRDETLDILNDGYSPADAYVFASNDLTVGLQQVGNSRGRCVVLENQDRSANRDLYCQMEFVFGGGSILVQGVFYEMAAIGGTGCYAGVQGWLNLEQDQEDSNLYGYRFNFEKSITDFCPDTLVVDSLLASPWTEGGPSTGNSEAFVDWKADSEDISPGDVAVFDTNIFLTAAGVRGYVEGECIYLYDPTTEGVGRPFCTMSLFMEENGDTLMVQGPEDNMVITSANGCFYGATGTISWTWREDGRHEYNLVLDTPNNNNQGPGKSSCPDMNLFDNTWTEEYGDLLVNYMYHAPDNGNTASIFEIEDDQNTPGDVYVFDNKVISVSNTDISGILSGRCYFLDNDSDLYCSIVIEMDNNIGSIAVQGDFDNGMVVIGGSGCFQGLQGVLMADDDGSGFVYTWEVFLETSA